MSRFRSGSGRSRPYLKKLTKDLEAVFRRSGDDFEGLEALAHELSFRERPKAIQLRRAVEETIETKKRGNTPPPSQDTREARSFAEPSDESTTHCTAL